MKKLSYLFSRSNSLKGFTLIEILAVFSIIAVLSTVSIASFSTYNNTQIFQTSAAEVIGLVNQAKSKAIAQIKPTECGTQLVQGYRVAITPPGPAYQLQVVCGPTPIVISTKKLGLGVTFSSGSGDILFAASTGTASPKTVTVAGYGKTTIITVDSVGTISVQ